MAASSTPPPNLDPPFRGYIETTFDALLVFEAARRGMIPRVTRRLIERERGMVQSGAVFVFDEHESGIKRWTDGLVWSPSRILGNFLVYRETDKRSNNPSTPNKGSNSPPQQSPPSNLPPHIRPTSASMAMQPQASYDPSMNGHGYQPSVMGTSPNQIHAIAQPSGSDPPPLGQGALARPRSASEGGGPLDRQRERQLVGSLTNSYKFKGNGLVKKTMSVTVNGFAQHMVSYYSVEDVIAGKLRSPSTIPELASLEISPEYLHKQNFRFPPMIEVGQDGIPRYRGEPEEPTSPTSPTSNYSFQGFPPSNGDMYDSYPQIHGQPSRNSAPSPRARSVTVPMAIPLPSPAQSIQGSSYAAPGSAGSGFYEPSSLNSMHSIHYAPSLARQGSNSSMHSTASGALRPNSSSRRYEPYGPAGATSPRSNAHFASTMAHRRQSQPFPPDGVYQAPNTTAYDVKPTPYMNYPPPSTAPGSFSSFYPPPGDAQAAGGVASPITSPSTSFAPTIGHGYSAWQPMPGSGSAPSSSNTSRLLPTAPRSVEYHGAPASSSSSAGNGQPNSGGDGSVGVNESWPHNGHSHGHGHGVQDISGGSANGAGGWEGANGAGNMGAPSNYAQPIAHGDWGRSNAAPIV